MRGQRLAIRRGSVAGGLLLLTLLSGCSLAAKTKSLFGGRLPVELVVGPDLNQNSPVAVEILVLYDRPVLESLLELSAREWFERRDQFERDFPDSFDSWLWEVVPGQELEPQELDFKVGAKGALVFADYFRAGTHRQRLDPRQPVRILLDEDTFTIQTLD